MTTGTWRSGTRGATARIAAGNLVSRITGLFRVLAVGGALGTTFLGNTYQSSNLVSNVLFELLAAGVLSSVLVPTFVRLVDAGDRDAAEELAGSLLGVALAVLAVVTLVGMAARPWIMRLLTVAVSDRQVRQEEIRLGSFFLVLFLPQVLLYAVGSVATALLHSTRRFTAAAFAPVANNVVVIATMGVFWALHRADGRSGPGGLHLDDPERLVLAVGTTAGVVAMTAVQWGAAWRAGFRLRPRWARRSPHLGKLGRAAGWAAVYLALSQLLVVTTLVLANRTEGGVVAYHIAFTVFLLPHAVLAHPILTAIYPGLAGEAHAGRWAGYLDRLRRGATTMVFLVVPASALMVALAPYGLQVLQLGRLDAAGTELVARVTAAYALGLAGYAGLQLMTRASYAADDTRTPTVVNFGVTVAGSLLMVAATASASEADNVVVLGLCHSLAMVGGAAALSRHVRRRALNHLADTGPAAPSPPADRGSVVAAARLAATVVSAVAAGVAARGVAEALPEGGRLLAAGVLAVAGAAGGAVYAVGQWTLGGFALGGVSRLTSGGGWRESVGGGAPRGDG